MSMAGWYNDGVAIMAAPAFFVKHKGAAFRQLPYASLVADRAFLRTGLLVLPAIICRVSLTT